MGSPTLANAVLDRLLHYSSVVSIKGPSYRQTHSREDVYDERRTARELVHELGMAHNYR